MSLCIHTLTQAYKYIYVYDQIKWSNVTLIISIKTLKYDMHWTM